MGKKKRKRSGPYCWCCERRRPNEKFSGKGHSRHLCRECSRLGAKELAYRQTLRNLERCITWEGIIPRKRRKGFNQFLKHKDTRIRRAALQMQKEDAATRGVSCRIKAVYLTRNDRQVLFSPHDVTLPWKDLAGGCVNDNEMCCM